MRMDNQTTMPTMIFSTIADLQNQPEFVLVQTDGDIAFVKDYVGKDAKDFDGFFIKERNGEMAEIYGFHGTTPDLRKSITKIMTPEERISTFKQRGNPRSK
jgi:hypothetical protein